MTTPLTMTPLTSSLLAGYHYDAASQRLTIEFKGRGDKPGPRYRYTDVPEELATAFTEADSHGKFFTEKIRNASGFGTKRLMTDAEKERAIADGRDPASLEDE